MCSAAENAQEARLSLRGPAQRTAIGCCCGRRSGRRMTGGEAEVQARREVVEQMTEEALKEIATRREWDSSWHDRQNEWRNAW
jgi:hypothetical protein